MSLSISISRVSKENRVERGIRGLGEREGEVERRGREREGKGKGVGKGEERRAD